MITEPRATLASALVHSAAGRADLERARHVQRYVVVAEICVKFALRVKRKMREAAVRLQARELGKPLAHEVEAVDEPRALDELRQLVLELERQVERLPGLERVLAAARAGQSRLPDHPGYGDLVSTTDLGHRRRPR